MASNNKPVELKTVNFKALTPYDTYGDDEVVV
jgi:hypothetical protein